MVIDKPCPGRHQRQGDKKEQVRRIADVHYADTSPQADTEGQPELRQDRYRVLCR